MKRVLIITYYWPPSGGAGVQRWLKFAKYLPEFGWEPIVLTVDPKYASYAQHDESLQQEIDQSLKVYRTKSYEFYSIYKIISGSKEIPYGGFANEKKPTIKGKISRFIRGNFFIPDPRKGWNREAYKKAQELIKTFKINTVITTSPPHSTQLIGLKLKKKLNINWIADFRDPWTNIYYYNNLYHTHIAKNIDSILEKKVLKNADQIITVSKDIARSLSNKIEDDKVDKIRVIPNGFDTTDFLNITPEKEKKFTITYTGTMSEVYDLTGFIEALSMLNSAQRKNIKLRFVGKPFTPTIKKIKEKVPEIEIDLPGYVEHSESIRFLMQSDLQLLVIPDVQDNKGIVTGKFFEYLASQKPILAIGPKGGDLEELINETGSGVMVGYNDSETITQWLSEQLQKPKGKQEGFNCDKYSRRMLTEKLSEIIDAPT
jgi:glycosyltransferase involved in cell wall biosynthesis